MRASALGRSSRREGIDADQVRFLRYGKLRYENQEHTRRGAARRRRGRRRPRSTRSQTAFHEAYEREYTYRLDAPVEFVGIHLVALAEVGQAHARASCR